MEKEIIVKRLKSVFVVFITIFIMGICLFSLSGCDNEKLRLKSTIVYIKRLTEIEIPEDCKQIFEYSDNTFHNGLHEGFYVLEFEEEPTDWLEENNFLSNTGENEELAIENAIYFLDFFKRGYFREYFEENKTERITEEFIPKFDTDYLWINKWKISFFYYPDTMRLMVYVPWL